MARSLRIAPGGMVYHVTNSASRGLKLFRKEADFQSFYQAIAMAQARFPLSILGWCLMSDRWHFVVKPAKSGHLSRFLGYLSLTHSTRYKSAHRVVGAMRLYKGRFKNFMIQEDEHLLDVLRYVEGAALRAGLVRRAQDWRWSSLHARLNGPAEVKRLLADWPMTRPRSWVEQVNRPQTSEESQPIEIAIKRGRPLGDPAWVKRVAERYDLQSTLRPQGRQPGWRKSVKGKRTRKG